MDNPSKAKPPKLSSRLSKPIRARRNNTNNTKATKSNPVINIQQKPITPKENHALDTDDQNDITNEEQIPMSFESRM